MWQNSSYTLIWFFELYRGNRRNILTHKHLSSFNLWWDFNETEILKSLTASFITEPTIKVFFFSNYHVWSWILSTHFDLSNGLHHLITAIAMTKRMQLPPKIFTNLKISKLIQNYLHRVTDFTNFEKHLESSLDHIHSCCRNFVIFRSKNMCQKVSLTQSSMVSSLQTKEGQRHTEFHLVGF